MLVNVRFKHIHVAILLAVLSVVLLTTTAPAMGLTWDEPTYIMAAERYMAWFGELFTNPARALSPQSVTTYWTFNNEHPPMDKVWSGLVWLVTRHLFDDLTAHRLGNMLLVGLLVAFLYSIVAGQYGYTAGVGAVVALMSMPRFFFHAHLAALDVPVTVMIFVVISMFWLSRDQPGFGWTLALGIVWGLALATKINALFVPPVVLLLWTVLFQPRPYLFLRLILMGLMGVALLSLSWPWLYYDSAKRLIAYLNFMTIRHTEVEQYYFGRLYVPPPWHFPFVMTLVVVPVSVTVLWLTGAWRVTRRKPNQTLGHLFVLGALVSIGILATGRSQVFDNERLVMPVFPFLAALAGIGIAWVALRIREWTEQRGRLAWARPGLLALGAVAFLPQVFVALGLYPHLLSYYSEAIGGLPGAQRLRLETTYWCETYAQALPYLNAHVPASGVIWAECPDVLAYYQLHGKLRSDLQIAEGPTAVTVFSSVTLNQATMEQADYVLIQYRQSGFYRAVRSWLNAREPDYQYEYLGIPLMAVYRQ
jgi:4-amino-4-deoxy-L-arabinose transferase-like glycosyltransferase